MPLLLAVLGHAAIGFLLVQQKWQRPLSPIDPPRAIEAYVYQPAPVVTSAEWTAPVAEVKQEVEPEEPTVVLESLEEVTASSSADLARQAEVSAATDAGFEPSFEPAEESLAPVRRGRSDRSGSLMERALQQLQSTDDVASTHRAEQQRRLAEPKITVERRFQQRPSEPAKQLVAQLSDGTQIIRTKNGCRLADPGKDGFEGLMAARRIPCGDEEDASLQLNRILQRRARP